jgi:hypothetical protein
MADGSSSLELCEGRPNPVMIIWLPHRSYRAIRWRCQKLGLASNFQYLKSWAGRRFLFVSHIVAAPDRKGEIWGCGTVGRISPLASTLVAS